MPQTTITLTFTTQPAASRGLARSDRASESERESINECSAGLFEIDSIENFDVGAARAGGEVVSRDLKPDDIVRVELDDGGELWLTAERLQELAGQADGELVLGSETPLARGGAPSRGIRRWLRRLSIVRLRWKDELKDAAATQAVLAGIRKIEGQLHDGRTGLHRCVFPGEADAPLFDAVRGVVARSDTPILILLHGTASSTLGSFSGLWGGKSSTVGKARERWNAWREKVNALYGGNVFALEHCSLSESPILNACTVLEHLAPDQPLHLVSHSRGGLVGELLCRGRIGNRAQPVTQEDIDRYLSAYRNEDGSLPADTDSVAARERIREELERLNLLLTEKRPRVERFARVGCPARGTTLAASRLDVYLSLVLSGVQLAGTKFLGPKAGAFIGALKSLLIAIARKRFDDGLLPGIKAMVPDGGMARFINDPELIVDGDLAVIAGNADVGAGLRQTLLVALTNLYYWQGNDWVVETDAMVGGHPRALHPVRFLDRGDRDQPVNHFSYFANDRTCEAILRVLEGTHRAHPEFTSLAHEPVKTKSRGERAAPRNCITVMLPGLPGSHLRADDNRVWLHLGNIALGRLHRLDITKPAKVVEPAGWFKSRYAALQAELESRGHRVVAFDYDWRLSLADNSRRLAKTLGALSVEARREGLPLRILAHSMGGWVALHWLSTETEGLWDRLCVEHDMRLVMAGTPLQGTFDTVQLLTARHPLLRMLAAVDLKRNRYALADQFRHYPGLLETLPSPAGGAGGPNFFDDRGWAAIAEALKRNRWTSPEQSALQQAFAVRSRVAVEAPPRNASRVIYLAGQDERTPNGVDVSRGRLAFAQTAEGDGLTTWASIPEWLKDGHCWYLPGVKHGDLLRVGSAFPAIRELVETGSTGLLQQRPPAVLPGRVARGAPADAVGVSEEEIETPFLFPTEDELEAAALHGTAWTAGAERETVAPCHVRIRHGNLLYADVPVMVGHYEHEGITGSEDVLDQQLDGRLRALHRAGLYPGPLNSVEILTKPGDGRTDGAVVVGLGPLGGLTAPLLRRTLRHALIRFARQHGECQRYCRHDSELKLASLVIGSGADGIPREAAVNALLEAVVSANRQLAELGAPLVQQLDIVEMLDDAAIATAHACARARKYLEGPLSFDFSIQPMPGGRQRTVCADPDPWWRRIQITVTEDDNGQEVLDFAPLTERAGIDVTPHTVQSAMLDSLLAEATADTGSDSGLSTALFELLVPRAFKAQIEAQGGMVLLVDDATARFPWELLNDRRSRETEPLACRIGLVRQLYQRSDGPVPTARNRKALVVGDTQAGGSFAELPGAQQEAKAVAGLLERHGFDAGRPLIRATAGEVIRTWTVDDYQIMHLAGHGVLDHAMGTSRSGQEVRSTGLILNERSVLGPLEIAARDRMPEIVFVNCCHLGANREPPPGGPRNELAANLGTQFIRAGVRCVVAAGWEVDDAAAELFARTFYEQMLSGETFGQAVLKARRATFDAYRHSDTWAAYQCYGDQSFRLVERHDDAASGGNRDYYSPREVEVEAANIRADLFQARGASWERLEERLEEIEKALKDHSHLKTGASCTAVALAWYEFGVFDKAIHWSKAALACNDSGASLRAMECRANALARLAEQMAMSVGCDADIRGSGTGGDEIGAEAVADDSPITDERRAAVFADAESKARAAVEQAQELRKFADTPERIQIEASAHKHLGNVLWLKDDCESPGSGRERRVAPKQVREPLTRAYACYREAVELAYSVSGRLSGYPLLNAAGLWLFLAQHGGRSKEVVDLLQPRDSVLDELDRLGRQFESAPRAEGPERFWDRTDRINLDLYRGLLTGNLHEPAEPPLWRNLAERYQEEFRLASNRERDSVIKQSRLLARMLGNKPPALKELLDAISKP
ncbi:CHAT domain-containing protein [Thioalkalivibrio paradoxus]|uniref:Uncharacterized protein n=1 Tax=Thioalkalivibrio paradoxus ARh 1 TaxID=713585 RepID=W0DS13_9GAMM|nr:CHAT domain-containing protein [Thioalkalivibrio paradoxus]AHF00063.1 hypothetical protein THITH_08280 [Thioalkalivibrio paradoxus ARh 1]